jgi:hypothetical protein
MSDEAPVVNRGVIYKWMAGVAVPIAVAAITAGALGLSPFQPDPQPTPSPYPSTVLSPYPSPVPTGPPLAAFVIKSPLSGKCLEIQGNFSNQQIVQMACSTGKATQQWLLTKTGPEQWKFSSPSSPGCLTHLSGAVGAPTRTRSGPITLEACRDGNEQQWSLEELAGRRWLIARYGDNMCINIPNGSKQEGLPMVDWVCNVAPAATNGVWTFEPAKT